MNSPTKEIFAACWRVLSEVPGWPDAPRRLRIRRVIPIFAPVVAMLLLGLWNTFWNQPRIQRTRDAHQPLLFLTQEIENLRLVYSDQHATDTAARAEEAARNLFANVEAINPAMVRLKATAAAAGWDATFNALTSTTANDPAQAPVYFILVRGKLSPSKGNSEPFNSLVALLERFSPADQWIELIRVTLRADEQGRHSVEVQLRAACRTQP